MRKAGQTASAQLPKAQKSERSANLFLPVFFVDFRYFPAYNSITGEQGATKPLTRTALLI
jgi:hypothetical protein